MVSFLFIFDLFFGIVSPAMLIRVSVKRLTGSSVSSTFTRFNSEAALSEKVVQSALESFQLHLVSVGKALLLLIIIGKWSLPHRS